MTTDRSLRLAVVIGSTRPGRRGTLVAEWVRDRSEAHLGPRADIAVVDIAGLGLPLLDEPMPAAIGQYHNPHTQRWARLVDSFDGFVFVTPSTTTRCRRRSRTPSTSSTASGTTRRPASSATASTAPVPSSTCA